MLLTIEVCHSSLTTVWITNNNTAKTRFDIVHQYDEKTDVNRISINSTAKNRFGFIQKRWHSSRASAVGYQIKRNLMSGEKKCSSPTTGGPFKRKWSHHKKCHGNKSPIVRPAKFQGGKEELGGIISTVRDMANLTGL
jgi:hypothetical protein